MYTVLCISPHSCQNDRLKHAYGSRGSSWLEQYGHVPSQLNSGRLNHAAQFKAVEHGFHQAQVPAWVLTMGLTIGKFDGEWNNETSWHLDGLML